MLHTPTSLALASLGWCARAWAPETTTDDLIRRLSVLDTEALAPFSELALREAGQELLEAIADADDESANDWLAQIGKSLPDRQSLAGLDTVLGGRPEEWRTLLEAEDGDERSIVVAARLMVWLRRVAPETTEPLSLERLLAMGWTAPGCNELRTNFYSAYCLALHDNVRRATKELEPVLLGARLEPAQWFEWLGSEAGLPPMEPDTEPALLPGPRAIAAAVAGVIAMTWWVVAKPPSPKQDAMLQTAASTSAMPAAVGVSPVPGVTLSPTPAPAEQAEMPEVVEPVVKRQPDPVTRARLFLAKAKKSLTEGNPESADAAAVKAQEILEDLLPAHDAAVGEALKELAEHWESRERWSDAARLLQRAVQTYEGTPAENAGPQLEAVNRWAGALRKTGRLTEAEKLYRTLLKAYEGTGPSLEVDAATVAHNLANALVDNGRFPEARGFYERALSLLADHWPTEDEAQRLAGIMGENYQHCLVALGLPEDEALAQTRRLLKLPPFSGGS